MATLCIEEKICMTCRMKAETSPSCSCAEYSSSDHRGMYSFTSSTCTWISRLKVDHLYLII